ncbi:MAG: glycosyltransferase family 39 protein [Planctomycetota bacterium]
MTVEGRKARHLLLLAVVQALWLVAAMPIFAQECYYWNYAQHLAWSYHDHPPMVAWLIGLGTVLFGNGALGIRVGTLACGLGVVLVGRALLREFGANRHSQLAWLLLFACVPILMMTRFLANPDSPLVFFWILSIFALWKARAGLLRWWVLAGLAAGLALLSKYTAAFLAAGGILILLRDAPMRRQLRRPGPWVGLLSATLTFSPVILWNVANHFESFRFQTANRWKDAGLSLRWPPALLGGQLAAINPVVACALPAALLWLWRRARTADPRPLWLFAFGLPLPLFMLLNSLFIQVKINWLVPAYSPLLLGIALWWGESSYVDRHPLLARRASIATLAAGFLALLAPLVRLVPQRRHACWSGWPEIAGCARKWQGILDKEDLVDGNVFFFASDYKDASQLTHSLRLSGQEDGRKEEIGPTLAQNVFGEDALQYDHWESPDRHIGEDAVFVLTRPELRQRQVQRAREHFADVEPVQRLLIHRLGIQVLVVDLFICRGYLGPD